jgi:[CysO sulfur-carrier protein]-S-L-cysteine hydrolase
VLTVVLPNKYKEVLQSSLTKAGHREIGGVLMGEHVGPNEFVIRDLTVHRRGTFASFLRRIEDAVGPIRTFFQKTDHNYRRFNYIGEWHSHPLFEPFPSATDDASMIQIVQDETIGATFAVLMIVKVGNNGQFIATAHTYLPNGTRHRSHLKGELE